MISFGIVERTPPKPRPLFLSCVVAAPRGDFPRAAFSSEASTARLAARAADLWRPLSVVIGVLNILLVLALVGTAAVVLVPRFLAG